MKKKYSKPYIYIESFQLDAALASGCTPGATINVTENDCGIGTPVVGDDKDYMFFNWHNCSYDLSYEDGNDVDCYHGPTVTPDVVFFAS